VEAAELLERFQWLTEDQSRKLPPEELQKVREEMADVLNYLVRLADKLDVNLARGRARKDRAQREEISGRQGPRQREEILGPVIVRAMGRGASLVAAPRPTLTP
jgi:NTP pyrophosphatase (non-canonical NTP hydrolase)